MKTGVATQKWSSFEKLSSAVLYVITFVTGFGHELNRRPVKTGFVL